jgi:hypothetical protein
LLGLMARLGVQVGGRVRKLRAVEDLSAPIPKREGASLEGAGISSDVRSEGQPRPLPPRETYEVGKLTLDARKKRRPAV